MKSYAVRLIGLKQSDGAYHYQTRIHPEIPFSPVGGKTFESEDEMVTVVNSITATQNADADVRNVLPTIKARHRDYLLNLTDEQAHLLGWPPQAA